MRKPIGIFVIFILMTGCSSLPKDAEPVRDSYEAAEELYRLGMKQYDQGLYESAAKNLESALYKYAALDTRAELVNSALSMGKCVLALGETDRALKIYMTSLSFAGDLDEPEIVRDAANHIANLFLALNDLEATEEWLEYEDNIKDESAVTAEYYRIAGTLQKRRGKLDEALRFYDKALAIEQLLPDVSHIGINYYLRASAYSLKGDYTSSEEALLKALEYDKFFELLPGIASDLQALGTVLEKQNRISEAVLYYARARLSWVNLGRKQRAAELEAVILKLGGASLILE
jgi:tetratricopeptide (TPR) repeat protein